MVFFFYDLISLLAALFYVPVFLLGYFRHGKYRNSIRRRLGFITSEEMLNVKECLWIHAVSVGEVGVVAPLVAELKKKYPHKKILVSTVTETGNEMARKIIPDADALIYFPLDFRWVVEKFYRVIQPSVFVVADRFLKTMHKNSVPIIMVNGRISDKSYKGYKRAKPFIGPVLRMISAFGMQTREDAARIIYLGAPEELVQVTGNLKFDRKPDNCPEEEILKLRKSLGLSPHNVLMVAGSTHPGEEEIVLEVFKNILCPELVLLIACRHPERIYKIEELVGKMGLTSIRRTESGKNTGPGNPVILLDTIGELSRIYSLATVVFVGGSLVPKGGQNPLEPAAWGKPVIFGPHMENFREIFELLKKTGGGIQVNNAEEFQEAAQKLIDEPDTALKLGQSAREAVKKNQGAIGRNIAVIEKYFRK
jgi:3-deoxy-D-manno-octulosonic-acid transferase